MSIDRVGQRPSIYRTHQSLQAEAYRSSGASDQRSSLTYGTGFSICSLAGSGQMGPWHLSKSDHGKGASKHGTVRRGEFQRLKPRVLKPEVVVVSGVGDTRPPSTKRDT